MHHKNKLQNKIQISESKSTGKQLCQCQCHIEAIVPVSHGNNCASLTWELSHHPHFGIIVSVSLGNNRTSFTWEHLFQSHFGTIVSVSLEKYFIW